MNARGQQHIPQRVQGGRVGETRRRASRKPRMPKPSYSSELTFADLRGKPPLSSRSWLNYADLNEAKCLLEAKEKPVDYSKLLSRTECDLGWDGKYDSWSDRREMTAGMNVRWKIEKLLKRLATAMDKHQSFGNRVHVLTVMRELLLAVLETPPSRVAKEVRCGAYQYDDAFVWAAEKLTPCQRQALNNLDNGKWMDELRDLIKLADSYCWCPKLPRALALISGESLSGELGSGESVIVLY